MEATSALAFIGAIFGLVGLVLQLFGAILDGWNSAK